MTPKDISQAKNYFPLVSKNPKFKKRIFFKIETKKKTPDSGPIYILFIYILYYFLKFQSDIVNVVHITWWNIFICSSDIVDIIKYYMPLKSFKCINFEIDKFITK